MTSPEGRATASRRSTIWVPVSEFNLPKGTQPGDQSNKDRVAAIVGALVDADNVDIALNKNASGQEYSDYYQITVDLPLRTGKYISTAGMEEGVAQKLVDLIKAISEDKDPEAKLKELQKELGGEGDKDDDKKDKGKSDDSKKDKPKDDEEKPKKNNGEEKPPGETPPEFDEFPEPVPPRAAAARIANEIGVKQNAAADIVRRVRSSRDIQEATNWLHKNVRLAGTDRPYTSREYEQICRIAWFGAPKRADVGRINTAAQELYAALDEDPNFNYQGNVNMLEELNLLMGAAGNTQETQQPEQQAAPGQVDPATGQPQQQQMQQARRRARRGRRRQAAGMKSTSFEFLFYGEDPDEVADFAEDLEIRAGDPGGYRFKGQNWQITGTDSYPGEGLGDYIVDLHVEFDTSMWDTRDVLLDIEERVQEELPAGVSVQLPKTASRRRGRKRQANSPAQMGEEDAVSGRNMRKEREFDSEDDYLDYATAYEQNTEYGDLDEAEEDSLRDFTGDSWSMGYSTRQGRRAPKGAARRRLADSAGPSGYDFEQGEWYETGRADAEMGTEGPGSLENFMAEFADDPSVTEQDYREYRRGFMAAVDELDNQARQRGMSPEEYHEHREMGGDWVWRGDKFPGDKNSRRRRSRQAQNGSDVDSGFFEGLTPDALESYLDITDHMIGTGHIGQEEGQRLMEYAQEALDRKLNSKEGRSRTSRRRRLAPKDVARNGHGG